MVLIFLFTCNDTHIHSFIYVWSSDCYDISTSCPSRLEVPLITQTTKIIVRLQFLLLYRARVDYGAYLGYIPEQAGFCLINHDSVPTLCAVRLKYIGHTIPLRSS